MVCVDLLVVSPGTELPGAVGHDIEQLVLVQLDAGKLAIIWAGGVGLVAVGLGVV